MPCSCIGHGHVYASLVKKIGLMKCVFLKWRLSSDFPLVLLPFRCRGVREQI